MVAVAERILGKVFLMLFMRCIKIHVVYDSGGYSRCLIRRDLTTIHGSLQACLDLVGDLLLLRICAEDNGSVLSTSVIALAIQGSRVVKGKEELNQGFKQFRCRLVEFNIQNFNMPGCATADLAIGRILHGILVWAHEAHLSFLDTTRILFLEVLHYILFGPPYLYRWYSVK